MLIMLELRANKKYTTNILSVSYEALIEDPEAWYNTVTFLQNEASKRKYRSFGFRERFPTSEYIQQERTE